MKSCNAKRRRQWERQENQIFTCSAHFWTFPCRCFARLTHQSIPVMPKTLPPPPWLLRSCCPPCQSRGWGIANFALPWGRAFANRAFDMLAVFYQNVTTQKILLEIQADWLICQWREIVKECYRFYACNSSLLIKRELHGKIGSYRRVNQRFFGYCIKFLLILFEQHSLIFIKLFNTDNFTAHYQF